MSQADLLNDLLQRIVDRARLTPESRRNRRAPRRPIMDLAAELMSARGDAFGSAIAREVLEAYRGLAPGERLDVFRELAADYGPDPERLETTARAYLERADPRRAQALFAAAEPRRLELFRRLNQAPGATKALVDMRADVIEAARDAADLAVVEEDLKVLFEGWFNRGFLLLKHVDWQSPAALLEKIIAYEAVHEIADWNDLRRRIDPPDRRLYAFLHPRLGDEPVIFVQVALMDAAPVAIAPILDPERTPVPANRQTTAVFYSISNCQPGLRGISFGGFLIKQVAEHLRRDFPHLATFLTLSPVPGFARWLRTRLEAGGGADDGGPAIEDERRAAARTLLADGWWRDPKACEELGKKLAPLAAWYLTKAKDKRQRPLDPVARFHLGNGARLERINWAADLSPSGIAHGAGVMVNYVYDLDDIEKNHQAYVENNVIAASTAVQRLARQV